MTFSHKEEMTPAPFHTDPGSILWLVKKKRFLMQIISGCKAEKEKERGGERQRDKGIAGECNHLNMVEIPRCNSNARRVEKTQKVREETEQIHQCRRSVTMAAAS